MVAQRAERYGNAKEDTYRRTLIADLGPGRVPATELDANHDAYKAWLVYLECGAAGDRIVKPPAYSQSLFASGTLPHDTILHV